MHKYYVELNNVFNQSRLAEYLTLTVNSNKQIRIDPINKSNSWIRSWLFGSEPLFSSCPDHAASISTISQLSIDELKDIFYGLLNKFDNMTDAMIKLNPNTIFFTEDDDSYEFYFVGEELTKPINIFDRVGEKLVQSYNDSLQIIGTSKLYKAADYWLPKYKNLLDDIALKLNSQTDIDYESKRKEIRTKNLISIIGIMVELVHKSNIKYEYPNIFQAFIQNLESFKTRTNFAEIQIINAIVESFNTFITDLQNKNTQFVFSEVYAEIHRRGVLVDYLMNAGNFDAIDYNKFANHVGASTQLPKNFSVNDLFEELSTKLTYPQQTSIDRQTAIDVVDQIIIPKINRKKQPVIIKGMNQRDRYQDKQPASGKTWDPLDKIPNPFGHDINFRYKEESFTNENTPWKIQGGSLRGLSHKHSGTYCDDSFNFKVVDNWQVLITADGMGSAELGRMGSAFSVSTAITFLQKSLIHLEQVFSQHNWNETTRDLAESLVKSMILHAAIEVRKTLSKLAHSRGVNLRDMHTTFLMSLIRQCSDGYWVINFQVGDGAIFGITKQENNRFEIYQLTAAARGQHASQTLPITSSNVDLELPEKISSGFIENLSAMVLMTDGVSEDAIGEDAELLNLMLGDPISPQRDYTLLDKDDIPLRGYLLGAIRQGESGLRHWLDYFKKQSNDDRTLLVMYRADEPFFVNDDLQGDEITKGLSVDSLKVDLIPKFAPKSKQDLDLIAQAPTKRLEEFFEKIPNLLNHTIDLPEKLKSSFESYWSEVGLKLEMFPFVNIPVPQATVP